MKQITRTFITTKVTPSTVKLVNGEVELKPLTPFDVNGDITEDVAIRKAKALYGKDNQYVVTLDKTSSTYALPVDVFLAHATKIVTPEKSDTATEA